MGELGREKSFLSWEEEREGEGEGEEEEEEEKGEEEEEEMWGEREEWEEERGISGDVEEEEDEEKEEKSEADRFFFGPPALCFGLSLSLFGSSCSVSFSAAEKMEEKNRETTFFSVGWISGCWGKKRRVKVLLLFAF